MGRWGTVETGAQVETRRGGQTCGMGRRASLWPKRQAKLWPVPRIPSSLAPLLQLQRVCSVSMSSQRQRTVVMNCVYLLYTVEQLLPPGLDRRPSESILRTGVIAGVKTPFRRALL